MMASMTMEHTTTDISDLLVHLHPSIDSIHCAMRELSDASSRDAEVARVEEACAARISLLRGQHDGVRRKIEERRRREGQEIAERRAREEREVAEKRRREDEERRRRVEAEERQREREATEEDERREREREEGERGVVMGAEEEIDKAEGEMRRRWEEGRKRVRELDEKSKVTVEFLCY
jgi:hypothetical protein